MRVPRGIHVPPSATGEVDGSSREYAGSARSRSRGGGRRSRSHRLPMATSISMDGSVNEYSVIEEIGPEDELNQTMVVDNRASATGSRGDGGSIQVTKQRRCLQASKSAGVIIRDGVTVRSFPEGSSRPTQQSTAMVRSVSSHSSGDNSRDGVQNKASFIAADNASHSPATEDGSGSYSSKDEVTVDSSVRSSRKVMLCVVGTMIVFVAIALLVVFAAGGSKRDDQENVASRSITNENGNGNAGTCQPGLIRDTMQPRLELTMTGLDRLMNESEINEVQRLILVEYNAVSGMCEDEFERWMYSVKMVNQSLTQHVVAGGAETDPEDFEFTLVASFRTMISCNGCTGDSAFASEFPTSFGNATAVTGDSTGRRRALRMRKSPPGEGEGEGEGDSTVDVSTYGLRSVLLRGNELVPSSPSGTMRATMHARTLVEEEGPILSLDAGLIIEAIERAVVARVAGIRAIVEAKVLSVSRGEIINTRKIGARGGR
jgi:hypothetical protein